MAKIDKNILIDKVKGLEALSSDEKAQLIGYIKSKTYGLVWEDSTEKAWEQLKEYIPVLVEDKDKAIVNDSTDQQNPNHILIEGDNLLALTNLCATHEGKIDVIYIDPPYNTGNKDFVYNDSYVDSEDTYRHSKWLSFMSKRLKIAKKLLSDRGVIFISIDDNEQAQLKLLGDEIFGQQNYISSFPWHSRQSIQGDTDISINHEYIVCFAKKRRIKDRRLKSSNAATWYNDNDFVFYPIKVDNSKYSNPDNDPRGPWKADPFDAPHIRPNLTYPIINPNTGEQHLPPRGRHWRISPEKFSSALADNRILFGKNGKSKPQLKVFLYEQEQYGSIDHSWLEAERYGTATHGSKELQDIFGGDKVFTSPKPSTLIVELLKLVSTPEKPLTILDFFAGSGTTLHATMQLNAEDGGHRQCIIVQGIEYKEEKVVDSETEKETKVKTNQQIADNITYERNKRVINGYTKPKGEEVEGLQGNNLRYFKVGFVPRSKDITDMERFARLSVSLLCIKEDVFKEETMFGDLKAEGFRYFKDGKKQFLVILDPEKIEEITEQLEQMDIEGRMPVYVYTTGQYPYTEDFWQISEKVELYPYPACIYGACEKVMPKMEDKPIVLPEDIQLTDEEENMTFEDFNKA